ncbi:APC family permease [Hanamia caeni]|jgi:amino acid transporter|uniref:APC family permease n=1 Tax=Hanamia caeni TaxID=2294116 RepID=A0A3M9NEE1_9BACT|nr:APC family permease [Hanamia caeni]RNI36154.1 APC family permease [Hanamia caeni]
MKEPSSSNTKKLSQLASTAICGNDITSSVLYVSALCIVYAGQYAFIALLIVGVVLFFFRKIYGEAVGALPLNGGAYNILLNTTSKGNASLAACLTILSYMATAVLSASEAMHYLHSVFPYFPVIIATMVILTIFLFLTIGGISESATVSIIIFLIHMAVLIILIGSCIYYVIVNGLSMASFNFHSPLKTSVSTAIFLGFSTAMLGITGFETSANFVEEQQPGVFPKTLRNMWILVTVINPVIALLAVCIIPLDVVEGHEAAFLSFMGTKTAGSWLALVVSLDAALVLSGAVLTAFIGVNGLMKRMTLDRIFPQALLKENKKGSSPRILIVFYILCFSILFITEGQLAPLAGVYTISFLSVMAFFGFGNLLLKIKRAKLPRPEYAPSGLVILGILGIIIALYGNVKLHPDYLVVFLQYFIPAILIIYIFLKRKVVIHYLLIYANSVFDKIQRASVFSRFHLTKEMRKLNRQPFVYFTKGDNIAILNKVIIYVKENEITQKLKIVTVLQKEQQLNETFVRDFEALDRAYPDIKIEYIQVPGVFGPEIIDKLSRDWNIPHNFMFIGSPSDRFPHRLQDLGGVRLII